MFKQRFTLLLTTLLALALLALVACTPADNNEGSAAQIPPVAPQIDAIRWELIETIVGGDAAVPTGDGVSAWLQIDGEQISGSLGCNGFSSSVTRNGSELTLGPIAATLMACEEPAMQTEAAFAAALERVARYTVEGDVLTLIDGDGLPVANLRRAPDAPVGGNGDSALVIDGQRWTLIETIVGGDAVVPVPAGVEAWLQIDGDQITGSLGCNNFNSSATHSGNALSMGAIASTRMACDEATMQIEAAFAAALERTAAYSVNGNTLTLLDADGLPVANLGTSDTTTTTADAEALLGRRWQWLRFESSDESVITVNRPADYWIEFNADGTYALQIDCNSGSGSYTASDNSVTINPGAMTLMGCPEDTQDSDFSRLFDAVTFVFDEAGNLVLNLKFDSGNMVFAPAE